MPRKRICPSFIFKARSKTPRHAEGLNSGNRPSATSISANAPSSRSHTLASPTSELHGTRLPGYFFAAEPGTELEPRIALKNSLLESTIITSDLLRKLERYASRFR